MSATRELPQNSRKGTHNTSMDRPMVDANKKPKRKTPRIRLRGQFVKKPRASDHTRESGSPSQMKPYTAHIPSPRAGTCHEQSVTPSQATTVVKEPPEEKGRTNTHYEAAPSGSSDNCPEDGILIQLTHHEEESWDSDSSYDSSSSDSSTPPCKRGRHQDPKQRIVDIIIREGMQFTPPKEGIKKRIATPSIMIFSDGRLANWPWSDKICDVHLKPGAQLRQWMSDLRDGSIDIQASNVFIYLEELQRWHDFPPLKNNIQYLCKSIRNQQPNIRIYIGNMLPRVGGGRSPLCADVKEFNFTLQQAIRSVCRAMGKIHAISIYEHFMSRKQKPLSPIFKYFTDDKLTELGCLVFRECLLREAGLKTYWFDGPREVAE